MCINELEAKARELRQLQALIEEAQTEAEAIKDAIKAAMGDSETIAAGEYASRSSPAVPPLGAVRVLPQSAAICGELRQSAASCGESRQVVTVTLRIPRWPTVNHGDIPQR